VPEPPSLKHPPIRSGDVKNSGILRSPDCTAVVFQRCESLRPQVHFPARLIVLKPAYPCRRPTPGQGKNTTKLDAENHRRPVSTSQLPSPRYYQYSPPLYIPQYFHVSTYLLRGTRFDFSDFPGPRFGLEMVAHETQLPTRNKRVSKENILVFGFKVLPTNQLQATSVRSGPPRKARLLPARRKLTPPHPRETEPPPRKNTRMRGVPTVKTSS